MRKTVNLNTLVNDCITMAQLAGNIVRDTHFKRSLLSMRSSELGITSGIKAAVSSLSSYDPVAESLSK